MFREDHGEPVGSQGELDFRRVPVGSVSPSVVPASERARTMTVTSGRKWSDAFLRSGPLGSLVKMCLGSSIWGSSKCSLTWKPLVIKRKYLGFRLVVSMRHTEETDYGLLPTPTSGEHTQNRSASENAKVRPTLMGMARYNLWPTPRAEEKSQHNSRDNGMALSRAVALLPTPTANRRDGLQSHGINIVNGSLNPQWVEWLMGYPIGWTDLEDLAMPSSRKSRKR